MSELTQAIWPFALLATVLVALFSASLVWAATPGERPHRAQSLVLMVGLPLAAAALYLWLGQPRAVLPAFSAPSSTADRAHSIEALRARLKAQPSDAPGWLMLARSHQVLGQYAEASEAFAQATHANPALQNDAAHMLIWAETRLLAADRQFDAHSHTLVARALALAPDHPDAQLLGALSALQRQDRAQARLLLTKLLDHHGSDSPDGQALRDTLQQLDSEPSSSIAPAR